MFSTIKQLHNTLNHVVAQPKAVLRAVAPELEASSRCVYQRTFGDAL